MTLIVTTVLIVASAAFINVAGTEAATIPDFPGVNSSDTTIHKWTSDILGYATSSFWDVVPASLLLRAVSHTSLDSSADTVRSLAANASVQAFDTPFEGTINGVDRSRVRWWAQAPNRTASDPVVLFLHGNGYAVGMLPYDPLSILQLYVDAQNPRLSVLLLDYTLSTEQPYPQQLRETASIYNSLRTTSDNVVVLGDSAGGHLALTLLRHIKYPVDTVDPVTVKPEGLLLISPWVNIYPDGSTGTYSTYHHTDIIDANILREVGKIFEPDSDLLVSAPLNQWKDSINWTDVLPAPGNTLVTNGEHEVLKGDIQTWQSLAGLNNSNAVILEEVGGKHDGPILYGNSNSLFPEIVGFVRKF